MATGNKIPLDHSLAVNLQNLGIGEPAAQRFAYTEWVDPLGAGKQQCFGDGNHRRRRDHLAGQFRKLPRAGSANACRPAHY